jgi:hypothetical protein
MPRKTHTETDYDTMPLEDLAVEYQKQLRAALMTAIEQLPKVTQDLLEEGKVQVLANALGVKRDWGGRWEVDHCNGRRSALANELGETVMVDIKKAIPDFVTKFAAKLPKGLQKELEQEYVHAYAREMRTAIRQLALEDARRDAAKAVEGLKQLTRVPGVLKQAMGRTPVEFEDE